MLGQKPVLERCVATSTPPTLSLAPLLCLWMLLDVSLREWMLYTDISTRKITPVYAFNHVVALTDCSLQSVILKTC